jgi:hypothetical protein
MSAREQRARDAELLAEVGDRQEVLLGERLRRSHECALPPVLHGAEQRVERDDGLARPDVALEQALHRHRAPEVVVDLADHLLLIRRQREGQRAAVPSHQLARLAEGRRQCRLARRYAARQEELEHKELFECQALPCALRLFEGERCVDRCDRVGREREPFGGTELGGQPIPVVARIRQRGRDEGAQSRRADLLRRRIHRSEIGGRLRTRADVPRPHVEAVPAALAAEAHRRARLELVGEPRLVEPRAADRRGAVGDACGDERAAAAQRPFRDVEHLAGDHDLVVARERGDRDLVGSRLVAARNVLEEIADGTQAELRELPLERHADARQRVELPLEPLGPRPRARGRPGLRLVQTCEPREAGRCCHRRSQGAASLGPGPDGIDRD